MYFPSSQIKTNQHTRGGELKFSSNNQEYIGLYFKTSTGVYYSGKSPDNPPNLKLIPISLLSAPTQNPETQDSEPLPTSFNLTNVGYNPTQPTLNSIAPSYPTPTISNPTLQDYDLGEFQRYFLKKTNEVKFIEVDKITFEKYKNKLEEVAYQLYQPFSLPWEISGDRNKVYNVNKQTVARVEQKEKVYGFKSYFRERYDQFYK